MTYPPLSQRRAVLQPAVRGSWPLRLLATPISPLCAPAQVTKAMDVTLDRTGAFPTLVFKDRDSYAESDTKKARPRPRCRCRPGANSCGPVALV